MGVYNSMYKKLAILTGTLFLATAISYNTQAIDIPIVTKKKKIRKKNKICPDKTKVSDWKYCPRLILCDNKYFAKLEQKYFVKSEQDCVSLEKKIKDCSTKKENNNNNNNNNKYNNNKKCELTKNKKYQNMLSKYEALIDIYKNKTKELNNKLKSCQNSKIKKDPPINLVIKYENIIEQLKKEKKKIYDKYKKAEKEIKIIIKEIEVIRIKSKKLTEVHYKCSDGNIVDDLINCAAYIQCKESEMLATDKKECEKLEKKYQRKIERRYDNYLRKLRKIKKEREKIGM